MATDRRGRATSTVRFRITALATVAVGAVLAVTAVGLVLAQRRALTENLDESLAAEVEAIADRIDDGVDPADLDLGQPAADDGVIQVLIDGAVLSSDPDASIPLLDASDASSGPRTADVVAEDDDGDDEDEPYRVVSERAEGPDGVEAVVLAAAPSDDIDETTGLLARSLAVAVPLVTGVLAVLVWALAGRTLRPVEAIRREVSRIGASDLERRVPVPPGDDEVARLARTMNAMLDRVEDAAERQRRFVGDASHELRTPLARMRSELEVDLAHPTSADPLATHRSVLDETLGMQRLVDDLLHLARADGATAGRDAGGSAVGDHPGDADAVGTAPGTRLDLAAAAEASNARALSPVAIDTPVLAPAVVAIDEADVRRVIANLLDNAARHARTHVEIAVTVDGEHAAGGTGRPGEVMGVLTVTDDGPGVPAGEADRIFERFARVDDARSRGEGGAGLGLAIAREIAERHGGTLVLDTAHVDGARFVLRLPLAPGPHR